MAAWTSYIEAQVKERGIPEKIFLAKKGDLFIWHSDLLHAGSPIKDIQRTRNSIVCHYYGEADCRRSQSDLVPLNEAFWTRRLRQPVSAPPEVYQNGTAFPEKEYLQRYPDVRNAVEAGHLPSGKEHYLAHGFKEGRGV